MFVQENEDVFPTPIDIGNMDRFLLIIVLITEGALPLATTALAAVEP
jgi:hypothetical protein